MLCGARASQSRATGRPPSTGWICVWRVSEAAGRCCSAVGGRGGRRVAAGGRWKGAGRAPGPPRPCTSAANTPSSSMRPLVAHVGRPLSSPCRVPRRKRVVGSRSRGVFVAGTRRGWRFALARTLGRTGRLALFRRHEGQSAASESNPDRAERVGARRTSSGRPHHCEDCCFFSTLTTIHSFNASRCLR